MTKRIVYISLMVAVASILFSIENIIHEPILGIRLGLANIITIISLKWWGMKYALIIVVLRVLLGSFLTGKFMNPAFLFSISGGLISTIAMSAAMAYEERTFSIIGISVIGSLFHNITQILMAYFIYIRQINILTLIPLFLLSSLITGIIIGFLAYLINDKILSLSPDLLNKIQI